MDWLWMSLYHALAMLWATFWALVMGFCISAALQVFVSKEQMSRAFGKTTLKSVAVATGIGAASSSCSYAAAAAGRSAVQQGAALIPALAFMFASTNLVIELGVVLWILMGWRFVLAEFLGAFVLIALVWLMVRWFLPASVEREARRNAQRKSGDESCHHHGEHEHEHGREGNKWNALANAFVMDWMMMWKELLGGFLIAGFIATLVPHSWWRAAFLQSGPNALRMIENALVGPIIAILSFVCSVGNIPLASHLWANGISFGGVISFIYADLLVVPLILIYGKYYGARAAAYITVIFYIAMVVAGAIVDLLFSLCGLVPTGPRPPSAVEHAQITWNYTSWLDCVAAVVFALLLYSYFRKSKA
jgi:uncharacterized membrane protein YraQ (UPF0718 family)